MRSDLTIPVGTDEVAAWLYRPADAAAATPCVVMAHGFSGVRDMRLDEPARRFASHGFAALVFDYRHFGDSTGQPRQLLDISRQYADWDAAIDAARNLPGVDTARIVLWGTSFAGGHVLDAAIRHPDVAAVIAQAPFVDGLSLALKLPKRAMARLFIDAVRDQWRALRGRTPLYVRVTAPPGEYAALPIAHVWESIPRMVPADSTWQNQVAPRFALRLGMHRPITRARRITPPLLIQVLDDETVLPVAPARKAARKAPGGKLVSYAGLDHFDIYTGEGLDRLIADQLAFLNDEVGPPAMSDE